MSRSSSVSTLNSARRSKPPRGSSTRTCATAPSPPLSTSTPPAKPIVIESAIAMQEQAIAWRHGGDDIGLVPTMGALHAGHDSLVSRAGGENQRVVVSIFGKTRKLVPGEAFGKNPRNAYRDPSQRPLAPVIHQAVTEAAQAFTAGETDPSRLERLTIAGLAKNPGLAIDYVAVVDDTTLSRPLRGAPGSVLVVAVKLGSTRLIDNVVLGAERL